MDGYYVPEFGVNSIDQVTYDMGLNTFISGGNVQSLMVEGIPLDISSAITLNPYMLNLISYLPQECIATDEVFAGVENDILLVSNDAGEYYLPSFGVMTMTEMCPGEAYSVFISSFDSFDFTYPSSEGQARSTMYSYWQEYNQSSLTQAYEDVLSPTGISHPIIITELDGDVSVGDELVAYADGQVVGATRISDLSSPVVISAWGGYH